jgi:hypothetical protein
MHADGSKTNACQLDVCFPALSPPAPCQRALPTVQGRLEAQITQLTQMLRALPHRRSVLEGLNAEELTRPMRASEPLASLLGILATVLSDIVQGIVSVGEAILTSRGSVLREISVQGQQVRRFGCIGGDVWGGGSSALTFLEPQGWFANRMRVVPLCSSALGDTSVQGQ